MKACRLDNTYFKPKLNPNKEYSRPLKKIEREYTILKVQYSDFSEKEKNLFNIIYNYNIDYLEKLAPSQPEDIKNLNSFRYAFSRVAMLKLQEYYNNITVAVENDDESYFDIKININGDEYSVGSYMLPVKNGLGFALFALDNRIETPYFHIRGAKYTTEKAEELEIEKDFYFMMLYEINEISDPQEKFIDNDEPVYIIGGLPGSLFNEHSYPSTYENKFDGDAAWEGTYQTLPIDRIFDIDKIEEKIIELTSSTVDDIESIIDDEAIIDESYEQYVVGDNPYPPSYYEELANEFFEQEERDAFQIPYEEGVLQGLQDAITLFMGDYDANHRSWTSKEIVDLINKTKIDLALGTDENSHRYYIGETVFNELEYNFVDNNQFAALSHFFFLEYGYWPNFSADYDNNLSYVYDNPAVRLKKDSILMKSLNYWYQWNSMDIPIDSYESDDNIYFIYRKTDEDFEYTLLGGEDYSKENKKSLMEEFINIINYGMNTIDE